MKKQPNPIILSRGNAKINKALIWNLPAGETCPGATKLCKQVCYAKAAAILHSNCVPQSRALHLELAKRKDFAALMIQKLDRARLRRMRIHESGDFFNQTYLNAWVKIIKAHPEYTFWAYTKSYKLDFTEALKLKNLSLRYSVDVTTKHHPKQSMPFAATSESKEGDFVCPSTLVKGHSIQCMKDCSFCVESKESMIFRPHGKKAKLVGITELQSTLKL